METRAHHVLIGLFTIIGVAALLIFGLWLARPAAERDYHYYIIAFDRPVSGLSVGNRVEYSGVRVGEVVDLDLNPEDPQRVRAMIRVDEETPVNVDTEADLSLANISGAMKIQLQGGTPQSKRLDGDIENPPVITAEPSTITEVLDTSEELVISIGQFLESANALLSEENVERVSQTLANLEQTTAVIAAQRNDIGEALNQLSTAMSEVTELVRNTDAALNAPERGVLSNLESASERVDRLLAENEGALTRGMQSFGELEPALTELRSALGNLNRITQRIEENPREFLFGGEEIEEFEP
ncbi:MCE family protein [Proteobacteria bacterium 005FR1]|nr:MCE family protein [Proteobacteria bacterium 005FR1]